jgi:hypothetical protein
MNENCLFYVSLLILTNLMVGPLRVLATDYMCKFFWVRDLKSSPYVYGPCAWSLFQSGRPLSVSPSTTSSSDKAGEVECKLALHGIVCTPLPHHAPILAEDITQ